MTTNKITTNTPSKRSSGDVWVNIEDSLFHAHNGTDFEITIHNPVEERIEKIEKSLDDIKHRLSILDDPNPKLLEKHKMLKDAYKKYKMIEALVGEHSDNK